MKILPLTPRSRSAFTLVELLVSVAVLSLLVLALFGIASASTASWTRAEDMSSDFREVRPFFDLLARDLQALSDNAAQDRIWIRKPMANTQGYGPDGALNYSDLNSAFQAAVSINGSTNSDPNHGDWIYFLAQLPKGAQDQQDDRHRSGLCTLGYYVAWTPDRAPYPGETGQLPSSYKLYRSFQSSRETFDRLASGGPATNDTRLDEVVARRVVDLFFTPYWRDATTGKLTFAVPQNPAKKPPVMIEVSLTIVSESAAKFLATRSAVMGSSAPWHRLRKPKVTGSTYEFEYYNYADDKSERILAQSSRVMTTRIYLERQ